MEEKITFYVNTPSANTYIQYDRETHTAKYNNTSVNISEDALSAFIHTAKELGFDAGKL